jgi:hypothetical protein
MVRGKGNEVCHEYTEDKDPVTLPEQLAAVLWLD